MTIKLCLLLLSIILRCDTRSISFVVKHQEFFAVPDDGERGHIPLSESEERLLGLTDISTEEGQNQGNGSPSSTDNAAIDKLYKSEEKPSTMLSNDRDAFHSEPERYDESGDDEDEEDDDEMYGTRIEDFHKVETKPFKKERYDIDGNDFDIESISGLKKILRKKRSAHEQWKDSLPGAKPEVTNEDSAPDVWEEVSDEELEKAQRHTYRQTLTYVGWTLLSVFLFVFIGISFLRDPIGCIFAFGTGCPCCLICVPCIRAFSDKYLDSKKIMREQMNKYMPGVIVNEDGTLDHYQPTVEELDALAELIDEFS